MRPRRYFLLAVILLVILGIFLTFGIVNSRRIMMDFIKEEARSFLSIVASTQENSIFAEGKYEDEIIEKLINICNYLETVDLDKNVFEKIRQSFNINSIVLFDTKTKKTIVTSGHSLEISDNIFKRKEVVFFEYFTIGHKKHMRFLYRIKNWVYQIEISAEEIQRFRQEFGINKIINQISMNPMVKYLVLQDKKGIIFATPNIHTITRIEDDSTLISVSEQNIEASRIAEFENENILELIRPFIVEGQSLGLFRIGISLDSYYRHRRETERQLILLFVILFGAGFVFFFLFMKYQSYVGLKELFNKTLGALEDGVLTVNSKGIITGINKTFSSMSSFEEKMLVSHDYFSLFKDDSFDVHKVLQEGAKIVDEKFVFGKNIQYSTYPLLDEKNKISGAISVLRDVTKIREYEKEREEAERLKFLGNLVANFAHEIKNPLNGLSIATQRLIKEFPSDNKEYTRLTTTVKKEIESLNKILNDFLSLARPRIKEKNEFNLSVLIQDTLDIIREQAKHKKIILKENIKKGIKLIGNLEDFKRAVLNILLNAIEALSLVSKKQRNLDIELFRENKEIIMVISDNGPGMDKDEIDKIFTPYFTTKKGGTGLGLYIAHNILKEHKAKITIESEKGIGTSFRIVFKQ
ncbi:GHKL domain-containing protein [candidate division WOR-3 bacterium]|nr:GHKL domain-containing protein [candidate division WOR-3 bacterium]